MNIYYTRIYETFKVHNFILTSEISFWVGSIFPFIKIYCTVGKVTSQFVSIANSNSSFRLLSSKRNFTYSEVHGVSMAQKQEASWTSLSKQSEDELLERGRAFNRITSPKPKEDDSRHGKERSKVRKPRPPILARSPSHDHIHVAFRLARLNSCSFFVR